MAARAVAQVWGCKKCSFRYESPVKVRSIVHHCPPKSHRTAPAICLEGKDPPKPKIASAGPKPTKRTVSQPEPKRKGRVLKRRLDTVE